MRRVIAAVLLAAMLISATNLSVFAETSSKAATQAVGNLTAAIRLDYPELLDNVEQRNFKLQLKEGQQVHAEIFLSKEPSTKTFLVDGKEVYIPVCLPERQMEAGRLIDMEHFEKGPLGLRNLPAGYEVTSPESLDLVLIPGLAVSQEGIRLGMGAGYYDRYLARVPFEKRVAALWDFQVIPDIPSEPFDQKIAKIVTDKSVIVTKRG